jgi:hypothetical protein
MSKEKTLLILWIIFGFVFIQAVDSLLYFLTQLIYFGTVGIEVPYSVLNFLLPIVTIMLYWTAIFLLIKKLRIDSPTIGILLTEFPKKQFLILMILAISLNPLTNKLSGIFVENISDFNSADSIEFIEFYGWLHAGIGVARWSSILILVIIFLRNYNSEKIKVE